jgi:hypothetical protein
MKSSHGFMTAVLSLVLLETNAQTEPPRGFKRGTIVAADGSSVPGLIKDNMRSSASVVFLSDATATKKVYDGSQLTSVEIDGIKFLCINKDFFKIISEGELDFLQKSSDARGKVYYNGNDPVVSSGTAGKQGDYFLYNTTNKGLKLITRKNLDEVITTSFENQTAAMEKAKMVSDDLSQLKEAVDIYNKRNAN